MTAIIDGTNGVTTPNVLTSSSGVALTLQSGGTTAVTIDTSQNILQNTTTYPFGGANRFISKASSGGTQQIYAMCPANDSSTYIGHNGTVGVLGTTYGSTGSYLPLAFYTSDTERMRLNTTGALVLAGGSTSASGIGIAFPATQSASSDANTLDDYEEGTWTPTLTNATTYGSGNSGRYIKIGKQVFINGNLDVSVYNNTGSTTVNIGGFPFATDSYNQVYAQGVLFQVVGCNQANMNLIMQLSQSQTVATLYTVAPTTGTNYTAVIPTTFGTQVIIEFSAVYISNA